MIWWTMFFQAGRKAHWLSLREIFTVLIIATSPLYLGALLHNHLKDSSYILSLREVVQRGELFLYCMSIVGSIVWLANKDWITDIFPFSEPGNPGASSDGSTGERASPPKWIFNLFSVVAFGMCAMFFGIEFVKISIASDSLITLSSFLCGLAILFWHVINVLSSVDPPNIEKNLNAGAKQLGHRLRNLRSRHGA